jgi:hypothetical protein
VILVGTYSPLAKFIKDLHETGDHPYFHTVSFVGSDAFGAEILKRGVDPVQFDRIIVTQVVPSPASDGEGLISDYRAHLEKFYPEETPNFVSLEGYVNARVLTNMMQRVGPNVTRKKLVETFENTSQLNFGIGNPLTFGPFDHNGLDNIYYSRLEQDGHFVVFDVLQQENKGQ